MSWHISGRHSTFNSYLTLRTFNSPLPFMERSILKNAISTLLGDVSEQCLQFLVHHPEKSTPLNAIIRECSEEMNYLVLKVDAHPHPEGSEGALAHYKVVSRELHKKSLQLMSRLQKVKFEKSNVVGGADE